MTQKVLRVGSSAAVTIPKKSLEELGLKPGDEVIVELDRKSKAVSIRPSQKMTKPLPQRPRSPRKKITSGLSFQRRHPPDSFYSH